MDAPHWTRVAFYLLVLPALVFWLIIHLFRIHDLDAQEMIATVVSLATLIYAIKKLG